MKAVSMDLDWLAVVIRSLHLLAAMTAVGGTVFMARALLPAADTLPDDAHQKLRQAVRSRWVLPLHLSITVLMLTGLYNIATISMTSAVPSWYHMTFGVKVLLALVIFYIAISLMGRSAAAERMRQNMGQWLKVNLALAVAVVFLSSMLSKAPKTPKPAEAVSPTTSEAPAGAEATR